MGRAAPDIPDGMRGIHGRFSRWRKSHTGRLPIPETLWSVTAEAAREHGVFRTAKVLSLEYGKLKRLAKESHPSGRRTARLGAPPAAFMELLTPGTGSGASRQDVFDRGRPPVSSVCKTGLNQSKMEWNYSGATLFGSSEQARNRLGTAEKRRRPDMGLISQPIFQLTVSAPTKALCLLSVIWRTFQAIARDRQRAGAPLVRVAAHGAHSRCARCFQMPHQMVDTRTQTKKISAKVGEICLVAMGRMLPLPSPLHPHGKIICSKMRALDTPEWMRFWWHFT